jgi:predicted ATPase
VDVIGREGTRSELDAALDSGERLVTLTGPGGIGKTTLARSWADERGGLLVDLTEAVSAEGVASKLALALEMPLTGDDHAAALAQALDPNALVVFDNCEQALDGVRKFLEVLRKAREDVRALATSREALGLEGERVIPVPLLDDESAVALLETRGRAAREGFSIEGQEQLATEVVRRLDRLPLAIELAAARLEVMTLEQLAARLEDQLRLLKRVGGTRDRHATLRETIAWSWDLLDEDGRRTLVQCAVFKDGFTLEAVEAVIETRGWADDALHDLKHKSLVLTEKTETGLRFRLLESVRAFAQEKLWQLELEAPTLKRFVAWFAPPTGEPRPWKPYSAAGCSALRAEMENLLGALAAAQEGPAEDPAAAAAAAHALDRFFASEGPVETHFRVLDEGVAAAGEAADDALLCRLLLARGEARRRRAQPDKAKVDFDRAEALAEGDERLQADVDLRFALLHMVTGDFQASEERARVVVEKSKGADPRTIGLAHGLYGSLTLYFGRDPAESALALERALPYLREAEDDRSLGLTLANLGVVLIDRGEHDAANEKLDEAAERFAAIRDGFNLATVQINRALSLLDRGEPERAMPLLEETRALSRRVGHKRLGAYNEMCVGLTKLLVGDLEGARAQLVESIERGEAAREASTYAAGHAYLALVLARMGEDATETLARADELAASYEAPWVSRVARVVRAHIEGASFDDVEDTPSQVRIAKRLASSSTAAAPAAAGGETIAIGPEARWMELPGIERKDLSRRGPLRRILMALADAHGKDTLDVNQLIEAGWPGEKMHAESGAARVYAAIRTLRKLGLEPWLITRDDGYLLDPDVEIERGE